MLTNISLCLTHYSGSYSSHLCVEGMFMCADRTCISIHQVCDGISNCGGDDVTDEKDCRKFFVVCKAN